MSTTTEHPAPKTAIITGASSGIGAATAKLLDSRGWSVAAVARRADRLEELGLSERSFTMPVDVTSDEDVAALMARVDAEWGGATSLLNIAGAAAGIDSVEDGKPDDWRFMYEINVGALQRMIAAAMPLLRAHARVHGHADIMNLTSTSALIAYEGGGGYNAAKFGAHALTNALRLELVGEPIRVIEIAPGMVKTPEFTLNRLGGDVNEVEKFYDGVDAPLVADDIADLIRYSIEAPLHVNLDLVMIRPLAQAASYRTVREPLRVRDDG